MFYELTAGLKQTSSTVNAVATTMEQASFTSKEVSKSTTSLLQPTTNPIQATTSTPTVEGDTEKVGLLSLNSKLLVIKLKLH